MNEFIWLLATFDMPLRKKNQKNILATLSAIRTATNSPKPKPTSESVGHLRPMDESGLRSRPTTMPKITAVAISW